MDIEVALFICLMFVPLVELKLEIKAGTLQRGAFNLVPFPAAISALNTSNYTTR